MAKCERSIALATIGHTLYLPYSILQETPRHYTKDDSAIEGVNNEQLDSYLCCINGLL